MENEKFAIKKGECILTEKPFVSVLKSKFKKERCDYCFTKGKVLKCTGCQYVYYCNKICQKDAWFQHKIECLCLSKVPSTCTVPDAARIMARIIFKLNNGGDYEKGYYTKKSFRQFKDLMSHYAEIKNDVKKMEHIESLTVVLRDLLGDQLLPNEAELIGIYGRMITNAFNILDNDLNSIGTGIYLGVSVTDHSCKPNVVATFNGTQISIHAIVDIPVLDWSKIFITYVDLLNTAEDRRIELERNYYFYCNCSKCCDQQEALEMMGAQCPNTICSEYIQPIKAEDIKDEKDVPLCLNCKTKVSSDYFKKYEEVLDFTKMHLENMKENGYLDVCQIILKIQKDILHPFNIWYIKTLDLAFDSAIVVGKWEVAAEYGQKLIPGYRKYAGDLNPLLGILYLKLGKIQLFLNEITKAKFNLKCASEILKITHGENHPTYATELMPLLMECMCSTDE